ncbi:Lipase-like PAD4 [Abeliophyllum distichum]|uniref:Lipase-like PAD4 n=1 Tax=Abeliophyllum distichum TaxID=126358 RepID=A0ABD1SW90_9LAMI
MEAFESSEMLATFLASTPLLEESWKLCHHANTALVQNFVVNRVGEVTYVAFPAVQNIGGANSCSRDSVALGTAAEGVFTAFNRHDEGEEPVMVHAGLLQLFLALYNTQIFRDKMSELVNESKSLVFTGHSVGGAIASLSALWLLSSLPKTSISTAVFCITFGSPMLGNESLSRAILHERWGGNFYHVVGQHDIVPRLLFAPSSPFIPQLHSFYQSRHLSLTTPYHAQLAVQLSNENKTELFHTVLAGLEGNSRGVSDLERSPFWPFGSYMFCTDRGSICMDNATAIVKLLYLMLATGSPTSCIEDHLKYNEYVGRSCLQYLMRTSFTEGSSIESSYEAGIALALQSAGINSHDPVYGLAKDSLKMANQVGCRRNLNNAKLAVDLSKFTPLRAQIEWYKAFCDDSDDQMGYYDSFKRRSASKRGNKVNMNRFRLALFWDKVIEMLKTNQLPYDFHMQAKYVNGSQFYKLLVEPLEIAEYYRSGMHKKKGHYIEHGREKRFQIFDKWWKDRKVGEEENSPRSKFANLTQDSCFWGRVEEARDCIYKVASEMDMGRRLLLLEKIEMFEQYASRMIDRKEVSKDVIAKNSSYNLFVGEWRELKSHLQPWPLQFTSFQDGGNMVP